jgi:hypothetical protein
MVEYPAVNRNDVRAAPFVIGVTNNTFALLGCIEESVKARPVNSVQPDIFMTIETQRSLRQVGLFIVAGRTFTFNFCMARNHTTGHDEFFQTGHLRCCGHAKHQQKYAEQRNHCLLACNAQRLLSG